MATERGLMIYDSKGRGYNEEQINQLMTLIELAAKVRETIAAIRVELEGDEAAEFVDSKLQRIEAVLP